MPQPLDDRIAAFMGHGARIADITALTAELDEVIAQTRRNFELADAVSKSATATENEAEAAAEEANKLNRRIVRHEAKREQLRDRHEELKQSERAKRAQAEYDQVKARRDDLVADLQERWPAICGEIAELLKRLNASDTECAQTNRKHNLERLVSAEAIARECPPNFYFGGAPMHRMALTQISSLLGRHNAELAWPAWAPLGSEIPVQAP